MKYVMFSDESFIIMPNTCSHNEIIPDNKYVKSAGYCDISGNKGKLTVTTYGESVSMGIKSKKNDGDIMSTALNIKY